MPVDKKTGLMVPAIYPCYKAEGLCEVRTADTTDFWCAYNEGACPFRKVTKPESKQDEPDELWDSLGRKD